ncbi:MAG: hypothetical protein RR022_00195 [Angelakisella sp.]
MQQSTKITAAMSLLAQKKELFLQYEAITDRLLEATEVDDMEKYITQRGDLAMQIDNIDAALQQELTPWGQAARQLLTGHDPSEGVLEELAPLTEPVSEIMTVVRRIRMKNSDAVEQMQRTRAEAEDQIKKAQNIPKINKYLTGLADRGQGNSMGSI